MTIIKHSNCVFKCDYCKKEIEMVAVELIGGYPSLRFDENHLHFCSDDCFLKFFGVETEKTEI